MRMIFRQDSKTAYKFSFAVLPGNVGLIPSQPTAVNLASHGEGQQ